MKRSAFAPWSFQLLFLTALAATSTGCQVINLTAAWGLGSAQGDSIGKRLPALEQDRWQLLVGWTPDHQLQATGADPFEWRWKHKPLEKDWTKLSLPRGDRSPEIPFRPRPELIELSRHKTIGGVNALIYAAQLNPRESSDLAPRLASIVIKPPHFVVPNKSTPASASGLNALNWDAFKSPMTQAMSRQMRAASAEAWCRVLAAQEGDKETLLAPVGRACQNSELPSPIRKELWFGLAAHVAPASIPLLASTIKPAEGQTPDVEMREAAVDACLIYALAHRDQLRSRMTELKDDSGKAEDLSPESPLALALADEFPTVLWGLRYDGDLSVRKRFAEILAVIAHPAALEVVKTQLTDREAQVHDAAFLSLGILGTPEARSELEQQAAKPEDRTRVMAVKGLAMFDGKALWPYLRDSSSSVRVAAVRGLSRFSSFDAARHLQGMLNDRSLEVQLAAVSALEEWPDSHAYPVLLESLVNSATKARSAALKQLERRRHQMLTFPVYADVRLRADRSLAWAREWNLPDTALEAFAELSQKSSPQMNELRHAELREHLAGLAAADGTPNVEEREWWSKVTPQDLPLIEKLLETADLAAVELLYRDVLPKLSGVYHALHQINDSDVAVRRNGAQKLALAAEQNALHPVFVRRLLSVMKQEQDQLVWRGVMRAIQTNGSDDAAQLALLALNNNWPDVRILGCEYVAYHCRPQQAIWIAPLLADDTRSVQFAAIKAAGRCRNPLLLDCKGVQGDRGPTKGLRVLLSETQGQLHFVVMVSMCQMGDVQAMEELTRWSTDPNSGQRLTAIQAMGESGQTRFVEPLIRLVWTEPLQQVKLAGLSSLKKLVATDEQPAGLTRTQTPEQAAEAWARWWDARQQHAAR